MMSKIDIGALADAIETCENALILGHKNPDGDCVGSATALAEIVEALGGRASICFPDPVPERLEFLLGGREPLAALPEDIDRYTVIAVDVASPMQLGSLCSAVEDKVMLRIDHHDVGTPYAAREFVEPNVAAVGEIIFDIYEECVRSGRISAQQPCALTAAFGAISSDSGCFKYANVTADTHLRAAKLLAAGVNASEINRKLFDTKSVNQLRAEGIAAGRLQFFANGKISGIAIDKNDYADGLCVGDFETAIDIARCVRGSVCAAVAKATAENGVYRVSMRSVGLDVATVAKRFGGGGHVRAAGCTLHCDSAAEALLTVAASLTEALGKED